MLEWLPGAFIHWVADPFDQILCAGSAALLDDSVAYDSLNLKFMLCAGADLKRWRPVVLPLLIHL